MGQANSSTKPFNNKLSMSIDKYLNLVEDIINKYEWISIKKRKKIRQDIKKIRVREGDPDIYLGVIGEFGSGKSTFINALIRDNLLCMDIIQATTSVATIIRYGSKLDIEIKYKNGFTLYYNRDYDYLMGLYMSLNSKYKDEKDRVIDFLNVVTANKEIGREIEKVTIFYPAEILKRGLVLIDTPGTNSSDDLTHIRVTEKAIREICDTAIVLIPSDIPLSMTLVSFLESSIKDIVHRCIFVVTKIDLIRRRRERETLMENIRKRIAHELSVDSPRLFSTSSITVIESLVEDNSDEDRAREEIRLLEQFIENENNIINTLEEQRTVIQYERMATLMSEVIQELKSELNNFELNFKAMEYSNSTTKYEMDSKGNVITEIFNNNNEEAAKIKQLREEVKEDLLKIEGILKEFINIKKEVQGN